MGFSSALAQVLFASCSQKGGVLRIKPEYDPNMTRTTTSKGTVLLGNTNQH